LKTVSNGFNELPFAVHRAEAAVLMKGDASRKRIGSI